MPSLARRPVPRLLVCLVLSAFAPAASAEDGVLDLGEVVVTAPRMAAPLTVVLDPRQPQQPVPANDGAAFLKSTPGFSLIRKGGTDGDPVLRGLAGSRLNVLVDGAEFHGGCGMRMDPPTAYIFPETFDKVTVIKGPQTVLHGNGNSAGVVMFEREPKTQIRPGAHLDASAMAGAWGRVDAVVTGRYGAERAYAELRASHAESDDYQDGSGAAIHSAYRRQSLNAAAGWRPDADTRVELSAVSSAAEAAYADRSMDGVIFDRQGYGLKLEKANLGTVLKQVKAQLDSTYIDHVMDNYSLRPVAGMYMVNNPDRTTRSAKLSADLELAGQASLTVGGNWQGNEHTLRQASAMAQAAADNYVNLPRVLDMESTIGGLFGEYRRPLGETQRIVAGLRLDRWSGERYNSLNGAFLADAHATLSSGFVRLERELAPGRTVFVGLGRSARPLDYWEASSYAGLTATAALAPEKTHQLDAGLVWQADRLSASLSAFYAEVDDYILTYAGRTPTSASSSGSRFTQCSYKDMSGMRNWSCSGNVDATRYGGEADLAWRLTPTWTLRGTLAWVHADNDSADNNSASVPLAQTPPLEGRLGLSRKTAAWSYGAVLRLVARQDRLDPGYGNIVGQDLATPAAGFATLALNAAYAPSPAVLLSAGIDNLFDRDYAEAISRSGSAITGYLADTRVNEPGRFIWAKASYRF